MAPFSRRVVQLAVALVLFLIPVGPVAEESDVIDIYEDVLVPGRDENAIFDTIKKLRPRIKLFSRAMYDGDFGSADVDWMRFEGGIALPIPISRKLAINPSISGRGTFFDFDGNRSFLDAGQNPGDDPFDDLYSVRFRLEGRYLVDEDWAWLGAAWVSSKFESGADASEAFRPGGMVAVSHEFREGLTLVGGLGINEKFNGGVKFAPFIQGAWQVNDWFKIETTGLGLKATAKAGEGLRVSLFGGINSSRYLLDDRNDGPNGVGEGWIRDRRFPLGVGLAWHINKMFRLRVEAGAMLEQKLTVIDENNDEFDVESMDSPAPFASIQLQARF